MFNVGDRVVFTNKGSWFDDFNGYEGVVEVCYGTDSYRLLMDEPVGVLSNMRSLEVKEEEISLIMGVE